jgi:DNA invertase Pin-like site-specific DNA recombinase
MKRAFALLRVSSPEQSLESQLASLKKIAETKGYEIPDDGRHVFQEKISGYDFKYEQDRKSIVELRAAINANPPEAIFIWELSRLSRRATKVYRYIDEFSIRPKIPMYFQDFELWTFNPDTGEQDDAAINKLVGAAEGVEREREMIIKRTSRGRIQTAEKGLYVGHLADGYIAVLNKCKEKEIKIDEGRAAVIRRIFDMYDTDGYSTYQIKDILISEKVPSTNQYRLKHPFWNYKDTYRDKSSEPHNRENSPWTGGAISRILTNEWYIGKRSYRKITYPIPPIIDIKQWNRVQEKLKNSRILPSSPNEKNFYLLQGLLYCGLCGRKMYGQKGGLNNHYYCSSKDSTKCGLIGICQDNVDAIIYHLLMPRIRFEAVKNANTFINTYFKNVNEDKNILKKRISSFKDIIHSKEQEEETERGMLRNYLREQARLVKSDERYKAYHQLIEESMGRLAEMQRTIAEYSMRIREIEDDIKKSESTISLLQKIDTSSLEDIKQLIRLIIRQIVVYNADTSITVLKITYVNGMGEYILYSPRLMPVKYIDISNELSPILYHTDWDEETKLLMSVKHTKSAELRLFYDENKKVLRIRKDFAILSDSKRTALVECENIPIMRKYSEEHGLSWEYKEYRDEIGVRDFVLICRKETKMRSVLRDYERLSPMSEKAKKQQEHYREWRKKYNTGLPTVVPYVVKDELYSQIEHERHKLYNRLYKIKNNKSRSAEDKEQETKVIKERLKELRYQIHYFGNSKNAKRYQK